MKQQIINILSKTPLILRVVSLYIILLPAVNYGLSVSSPMSEVPVANVLPQVHPEPAQELPIEGGVPKRIELPRIGLVREVADGDYDESTNQWSLSDDKAHFATMTTLLNNVAGQTLIYGHNTRAVLEPVKNVQDKDELLVTTEDGTVFVYEYSHDRFVLPTDTSVLYEEANVPRVVLMTCEGWFSDTRRLLYFDFKEVR